MVILWFDATIQTLFFDLHYRRHTNSRCDDGSNGEDSRSVQEPKTCKMFLCGSVLAALVRGAIYDSEWTRFGERRGGRRSTHVPVVPDTSGESAACAALAPYGEGASYPSWPSSVERNMNQCDIFCATPTRYNLPMLLFRTGQPQSRH
jgi:hypothetical protein